MHLSIHKKSLNIKPKVSKHSPKVPKHSQKIPKLKENKKFHSHLPATCAYTLSPATSSSLTSNENNAFLRETLKRQDTGSAR